MKWKSHIAILFALIFFGKFLVMDSRVLVSLFDAHEIVYVNPFCIKQNAKIAGTTHEETIDIDSHQFNITWDSFCNAPFEFEVYSWKYSILPEESGAYAYNSPSFPDSNKDRFYPPPKGLNT